MIENNIEEFNNIDNNELIKNFNQVKKDLKWAENNYQFAQSVEAIDYYIYQIKACQSKFDNLLKQIKQIGKIDILQES